MAKSIKLENNNYIDSTGIVHNRELLSEIINKAVLTNSILYVGVNPSDWDQCYEKNKIKIYRISDTPIGTKGMPKNAYRWGLLISIYIGYECQIYITDYVYNAGVFIRFLKEDWSILLGTKVEKNT